MDKFDLFIRNYDCSKVDQLPRVLKKRLNALKKIQLEHIDLLHEYHKEIQELEMKYEKLYKPLYEKRFKIVSGEHEPTEEECQLPDNIENECDDQENKEDGEKNFSVQDEKIIEAQVKGMPAFWLGCLSSTDSFNDSIEPQDRNVLKHLQDIRLSYGSKGDLLTYTLEFVFNENPFFTNNVLTKTYYLKLTPDEKDPFSYEGFEVIKSEGCEINWNSGKNTMVKTLTLKQQNKRDGSTREKKKEVERDSFFYFFKPPVQPEQEVVDDETSAVMAVDFELGEIIRQNLIPRASLIYSGHIIDEEISDDEDDESSDEEEFEDSDSDRDTLDESDDSLTNNGKDK